MQGELGSPDFLNVIAEDLLLDCSFSAVASYLHVRGKLRVTRDDD
jgi:hypothetical protein